MEKVITTLTYHEHFQTEIKIDNSTEYKDFFITRTSVPGGVKKEVQISISGPDNELKINDIKLIGREIDLLREFLNQHQ